ncbi:MAG: FMN-binding negative transcriptional regulator [Terriglobia bacterium]
MAAHGPRGIHGLTALYIPEYNRLNDRELAVAFMKAHPFAIVVSSAGGSPFATHIPVLVSEAGGTITLRGHVARANPQWERLKEDLESLVIFHGPHAYISPRCYDSRESVPTWNYAAIHAYGGARVFCEREPLTAVLLETMATFDASYLEQWREMDDELRAGMLRQIVGFEITVGRLEAKFKLSQNRSKADQARVIESLESSADSAAAEVAKLMRDRGLGR